MASIRDLEYHSQLLRLLGLKGQANRDAVITLHMGGVFGDKKATLGRFRESYTKLLSDDIKARLVLENDDVASLTPLLLSHICCRNSSLTPTIELDCP